MNLSRVAHAVLSRAPLPHAARLFSEGAVRAEVAAQSSKKRRAKTRRAQRVESKPEPRLTQLKQRVKFMRDPLDMEVVVGDAGVPAQDIDDPVGHRGVFVKPTDEPNLDERIDQLLKHDEGVSGQECLETLTEAGEKLSDEHIARLVTHTVTQRQLEHGVLTTAMFDAIIIEAEELVRNAESLGHKVGPLALSCFLALHANPTSGVARDTARCLELLQDPAFAEKINVESGFAFPWVYDMVLQGCALDDDEETALELLRDIAPPLSDHAYEFAISSCNTVAAAKGVLQMMEQRGVAVATPHRVALMKVAVKAKATGYAQELFAEIQEAAATAAEEGGEEAEEAGRVPADAHLALLASKCAVRDTEGARSVFFRMMVSLRNSDINPEFLCSLLHICLIHVKDPNDVFCEIASHAVQVAEKLGFDRDIAVLTRASWIFAAVGDEATVERLSAVARRNGAKIDGHHFEQLRQARFASGNRLGAMMMFENELQRRRIPYEMVAFNEKLTGGGYRVVMPKIRAHSMPRSELYKQFESSQVRVIPTASSPKNL